MTKTSSLRAVVVALVAGIILSNSAALAIDREESEKAIKALIAKEKKELEKLQTRKKDREKEHKDTSDLDDKIRKETARIEGKQEILGIIAELGGKMGINAKIKEETAQLEKDKAEVARLRKLSPKPQEDIDKLDKKIADEKAKIKGKEEARAAVTE